MQVSSLPESQRLGLAWTFEPQWFTFGSFHGGKPVAMPGQQEKKKLRLVLKVPHMSEHLEDILWPCKLWDDYSPVLQLESNMKEDLGKIVKPSHSQIPDS